MKKLLTLLVGLSVFAGVQAQTFSDDELLNMSLEELMQVEITVGSRTVKNPDFAPGAITVINQEDIEAMQARSLRDVLNILVPGMDVVPSYFAFGETVNEGISSRGVASDFGQQVLILVNGQNKWNESTFGSAISALEFTLDRVERIEINRSPAPILGGGALTTINLVTKEANMRGTELRINAQASETTGWQGQRVTINHGSRYKGWKIGASLQFYQDKGQALQLSDTLLAARNITQPVSDGTPYSVTTGVFVQNPTEKFKYQIQYKSIARDAALSSLQVTPSSHLYPIQSNTLHHYLLWKPLENLEISVGNSFFDRTRAVRQVGLISEGVNTIISAPYETWIQNYSVYARADYIFDYKLLGDHTLHAGIRVEREGQTDHRIFSLDENNTLVDVSQTDFARDVQELQDVSRWVLSGFAENNWTITEKMAFLIGLRVDQYQNFGVNAITALSPRMAFSYLISDGFVAKISVAQAVRPPSSYELLGTGFLSQLYGSGVRNALNFEQLRTRELGLKYSKKAWELSLTLYNARFHDRIVYLPSAIDTTALVATNAFETQTFGVEFTARYTWQKGNYAFLNASQTLSQDVDTGIPTYFIPSTFISGGINLRWKAWNTNVTAYYRGKRFLPDYLPVNAQLAGGDHYMVNLATSYQWSGVGEVYVQVQNLTNAINRVPLNRDGMYLPMRQREFNVGVNLKF